MGSWRPGGLDRFAEDAPLKGRVQVTCFQSVLSAHSGHARREIPMEMVPVRAHTHARSSNSVHKGASLQRPQKDDAHPCAPIYLSKKEVYRGGASFPIDAQAAVTSA